MIPFLSQLDYLVAAGVVTGLTSVGGAVFALARHQRPATGAVAPVAVDERVTAGEPATTVAAA